MELLQNLSDEELTADIKAAFVNRKRKTKNGVRNYELGVQFDKNFSIAAKVCRRLNACPILLIDSVFHDADADKIFPTFLSNESWVTKKYNKFIDEHHTKAADLFPVLTALLRTQLEAGRTLEEVLLSSYLNFPAWFRVCISKHPIPEVMKKYGPAARLELNLDIKQLLKNKNLDYRRLYGI